MYDIAIVGAGPAGMTAALYAARAGKQVLLLEAESAGGQIINARCVENYPGTPAISGVELVDQMLLQLREIDLAPISANVVGLRREADGYSVLTDRETYAAKAVILAAGVGHRKLGVSGEEQFIGRGVSFCATCDGRFFKERDVAVVGGGNTAAQDVLSLAELCRKVYLIHRRAEFRAEKRLMDRVRALENVEIITDTAVCEIKGEFALQAVVLRDLKTEQTRELAVSGVFEAVGNLPRNAVFEPFVTLDKEGYILTDDECKTKAEGIFAAGDCRQKTVRQLTTATSDGTVAALAACRYLDGLL